MLRLLIPLTLSALATSACSDRDPRETLQDPEPSGVRADAPQASTTPSDVLFGFETREHQLYVHSTATSPLYTVKSRDGRILADQITEAELGISYPDLHDILNSGVDRNDGPLTGIGYPAR
jgi:hypothetical protein